MNDVPTVLVTAPLIAGRPAPYLARLGEAGYHVVLNEFGRIMKEDELARALPGVFAVIAGTERWTESVLAEADALRLIARFGVGYDQIDTAAAGQRGIAVTITAGANHDAVADHAFAMMAALASELLPHTRAVLEGRWPRAPRKSLSGATLGIVGAGRIGLALARRCQAFNMTVLGYDPYRTPAEMLEQGIEPASLSNLLARSDFVSLHVPLTGETRHMIGREQFAQMKSDGFLINTARGGLIDEEALLVALTERRISGAALDVFEQEPPEIPQLMAMPNLILTPHIAGVDECAASAMADSCIDSILAVAAGRLPGPELLVNQADLTH